MLKGKQKKLDKNNNGRIDAEDFKLLKGSKKAMRMGGMMYANEGKSVDKFREIAKGRLNERAKQINQKKADSFSKNLGGKGGPKLTARDKEALQFIKRVEARDATGKKSVIDDIAKRIQKREESPYNVERGMGTGYKKGKMIRMKSGGMNSDRMTEKDIKRAYNAAQGKKYTAGAMPGNKAAAASMNSDRMTSRDIEAAKARLETSAIRNKYRTAQLEKALRQNPKNPDRLTNKDIEKASSAVGKRKGGMLKAKSGKLADAMKKLREKAYDKSGKKYKDVGKFGKDEYMIQKKLPGIKKGKMIKAKTGKSVDTIKITPTIKGRPIKARPFMKSKYDSGTRSRDYKFSKK